MNIGDAGSEMHTREGDCNLGGVIECTQRPTRTSHHTLPSSDHHCHRPPTPQIACGEGCPAALVNKAASSCWAPSGVDNMELLQHINSELRITLDLPHGSSFLQSCHGRQAFRHMPSFPDTLWTTGAMVADVAKQSPNGDISAWSLHPSRMSGEWTNRSDARLQIELA